jgi:hypothetical protein
VFDTQEVMRLMEMEWTSAQSNKTPASILPHKTPSAAAAAGREPVGRTPATAAEGGVGVRGLDTQSAAAAAAAAGWTPGALRAAAQETPSTGRPTQVGRWWCSMYCSYCYCCCYMVQAAPGHP